MKTNKKILVISFVSFLTLTACTTPSTIILRQNNPFSTPFLPNLDQINDQFANLNNNGLETTDPNKCIGGDLCYFQYINDRSFSIYKNVKTAKNPLAGGWGTGWFVDREVGTNNFYITTNIHVANLAEETIVPYNKPNPDPELLSLLIGRLPLNPKLLNNDNTTLLRDSYFNVNNWTNNNHTNLTNRILTKVDFKKIPYTNPKDQNYFLTFTIPDRFKNGIFLPSTLPKQHASKFAREIWVFAKKLDQKNNFTTKLFSANDIAFTTWYDIPRKENIITNNINVSGLKFSQEDFNKYFNTAELQKEININVPNTYGYIDQATLKVTIPNQVLAAQFPYFLNPKKYNQWTFPKFSQKQLPDTKDKNGFQITDSNKLTTIYQAGYPVENLKGNLSYSAKGGPTFRMAKGKIVKYLLNNDMRNLDNFNCEPNVINKCKANQVPMAGYDLALNSDYSTGGGSSGSMVIDKNYNTIGIYFGGTIDWFNNLPSKYKSNDLAHPLYWNTNKFTSAPVQRFYFNNFSKQAKTAYLQAFNDRILNNYLKETATKTFDKYKAKRKNKKTGIRFDNIENLKTDLKAFFNAKNNITNQAELNPPGSDSQAIKVIYNALKLISQEPGMLKQVNELFDWVIKKFINEGFYLQLSTKLYEKEYKDGIVDYKSQLINHFKKHNIKTYHLNPK